MLKPAHCDADIAIDFVHAANVVGVGKELGQRTKKHEECDQFVVGCAKRYRLQTLDSPFDKRQATIDSDYHITLEHLPVFAARPLL